MKKNNYFLNKEFLFVLLICILSIFFISGESLWGDEICRVEAPISGSLIDTLKIGQSYGQIGYMSWIFVWVRIFGGTEFLLRISNIPFVVIACLYTIRICKKKNFNILLGTTFFVNPIFLYYVNEVTPYIALYALSIAFIYYVFFSDEFLSKKNAVHINTCFLIGFFIHFIFGFIIFFYLTRLFKEFLSKKDVRAHIKVGLIYCVLYLPVLGIDLIGLRSGGTISSFSIINVLYIVYAFCGMGGLGLSRNDLRARNFEHLDSFNALLLLIYSVSLLLIICFIIKKKNITFIKNNRLMLVATLIYSVAFVCVSIVIKFGMWERHCISAYPIICILICEYFSTLRFHSDRLQVLLCLFIACILSISIFNTGFNYYYNNDDFKSTKEYIEEYTSGKADTCVLTNMNYNYNYFDKGHYYEINSDASVYCYTGLTEEKYNALVNQYKEKQDVIVVLFEKAVSPKYYKEVSKIGNYELLQEYNSFKILKITCKEYRQ